jgi:hypothetical protein
MRMKISGKTMDMIRLTVPPKFLKMAASPSSRKFKRPPLILTMKRKIN